jgi:hypothetical protein
VIAGEEPLPDHHTGISRIDAAGDDALIPGFVLGILDNASRDRERAFALATAAIGALLGLEFA